MAKVVLDEFHLTLLVARHLAEAETITIRRTLGSRRFRRTLLRAARTAVRHFPSLSRVRVRLSR